MEQTSGKTNNQSDVYHTAWPQKPEGMFRKWISVNWVQESVIGTPVTLSAEGTAWRDTHTWQVVKLTLVVSGVA